MEFSSVLLAFFSDPVVQWMTSCQQRICQLNGGTMALVFRKGCCCACGVHASVGSSKVLATSKSDLSFHLLYFESY